jgi:ribonuclease J
MLRRLSSLRIVPLGGLGEIGMNCLLLEQDGARLVVDCGATFPSSDHGVDIIHPRFDHLLDAPIAGVALTHGHEDHIGALGQLLLALDGSEPLPIWGPPYALALCRRRLDELGLSERATLTAVAPGERFAVGPFGLESIRVTHSTPQSSALAIETDAGMVIHSGDFKLDPNPPDGLPTDEKRLGALGDRGVALLLSDSTNVLAAGSAAHERAVAERLAQIILSAEARVVVSAFASNLHRLDAVAAAARAAGRKLCLLGRSMHTHADVGRELGILDWKSDAVVSAEVAARMPRDAVAYLATGTQAEPRGALARLAYGNHYELALEAGDLMILSSRIIPGNEIAVHAVIDALLARGVQVRSGITEPALHASGHAHRAEQRRMIELTRPRSFIPLHGTRLHLEEHAALARAAGVEDSMVVQNGEVAELREEGLRAAGTVPAGRVAIAFGRPIADDVVRQRRQLGRGGVMSVALDAAGGVAVRVTGLPDAAAVTAATRAVARATWAAHGALDDDARAEEVRRAVRARAAALIGYKPMVLVSVVRP